MSKVKAKWIEYDRRTLEEDQATGGIKVKISQGSPISVGQNGLTIANGSIGDVHIISMSVNKLSKPVIQADGTVAFTGPQSMGGQRLTNLALPSNELDAVNVVFVERRPWKAPVRVVATENINTMLGGLQTVDSVQLAVGNRVLLCGQTDKRQNGIYVVSTGQWVRASDANTSEDLVTGAACFVIEGSERDSLYFLSTLGFITLGTTELYFTKFSGSDGSGSALNFRQQGFFLTVADIANKYVELTATPKVPEKVILQIIHGPDQKYNYDYRMDSSSPRRLTWAGFTLESILSTGDELLVSYET